MKVYVAGASSEMERAEQLMAALRAIGIDVVSTWPEVIRKVGAANPMTASREQRATWSAIDLDEVSRANVFWLLLPKGRPTAGAYTEFGYAVMHGALAQQARELGVREVPDFYWIIASGEETSIFTALADHFATDEMALNALTLRWNLIRSIKKTKGPEVSLGARLDGSSSDGG
jgi:hypothetical protein